jgi:hypothetical protein
LAKEQRLNGMGSRRSLRGIKHGRGPHINFDTIKTNPTTGKNTISTRISNRIRSNSIEVVVDISEYTAESGIEISWWPNSKIKTYFINNVIHVSANKEGLTDLAGFLLTLAQEKVPPGHHLHLDESNVLQSGSREMIFIKGDLVDQKFISYVKE